MARAVLGALLAAAVWLLPGLIQAPARHGAHAAQTALGGHGSLLIAYDHALALRNLATGSERTLFQFSDNEFVRSPEWLPGGQGFLFIDQTAYTGDRSADYGGDIWEANANGSGGHIIWHHDVKGVDVYGLGVAPDASWLVFGYTRTDLDASGNYTGQVIQLMRLDMTTGVATKLVDQASNPAVSPDGRSLVYLNLAESDANDFGLWISNADGSNPRPLVTVQSNLMAFFSPQFSPDGSTLLFASYLNPLQDGSSRLAPGRGSAAFGPSIALADGPPQDIWIVHPDGSGLLRLTSNYEDQPSAAWSGDGSQVLVFGSKGLYIVNADGTGFTRLGDGALHAQIAWLDLAL